MLFCDTTRTTHMLVETRSIHRGLSHMAKNKKNDNKTKIKSYLNKHKNLSCNAK